MTRRRWIADEVAGDRAALVGSHGDHLARVLRARVGQEFEVVAGDQVRRGIVTTVNAEQGRVEFDLGELVSSEDTAQVTLLLAVFKFDRMEWAIEKCTELGVSRIVPVVARRTEVHLAKTAEKRVERWRRLAVQASEQSRRMQVPEIADPLRLTSDVLESSAGKRVVLAESEQQTTVKQVLHTSDQLDALTLAVGPEGGWTDDELRTFHRNEFVSASLGKTILRAETAAIAAMAVVMAELN